MLDNFLSVIEYPLNLLIVKMFYTGDSATLVHSTVADLYQTTIVTVLIRKYKFCFEIDGKSFLAYQQQLEALS